MAEPSIEEIVYRIRLEAQDADATIETTSQQIMRFARVAGVSLRSVSDAWKKVLKEEETLDADGNLVKVDKEIFHLIDRSLALATAFENVRRAKEKALAGQEIKGQGIIDAGIAKKNAQRSAEELQAQSIVDAGIAKRNAARTNEEKQAQAIVDAGIAKRNADRSAEELRAQEIVDAGIAKRNAARKSEEQKGQSIVDAKIAQDNALAKQAALKAEQELSAEMKRGQAIIDAGIAKKNADQKAQEALNLALQNGTATNAQYAESLRKTLSLSTQATLGGISPTSPVSPQMISQIKAGMQEIQSITGLNVDRIKAILKTAFSNIPTSGVDKAAKLLKQELGQVEQQAKKTGEAGQSMWSKFQNTTLGILVARAILGALNYVKQFFQDSLKYAQDARSQMVQLNFAESVLSKRGMDITRDELDKFIADIEAKYKYLSNLEATKVVSETAGAVAEFDVSKEQLGQLAEAIAFIQTKNKLLGKEEADAAHIINAAMDARSNFFNGMGINITETIVKEKAYAMQLAKVGDELTKQQRFQAILALLTEQTAGKQQELNDALEGTPLGNQMLLTQNYKDALGKIGEQFLTVKDNAIQFLSSFSPELADGIIGFFTSLVGEINLTINAFQKAVDGATALSDAYALLDKNRETNDAVNVQLTLSEKLWAGIWELLKQIGDALWPLETILAFLQGIGTLLATVGAAWVTFWVELTSGFDFATSLKDAGKAAGDAFITGMSQSLATGLKNEDGWLATKLKEWWKEQTGVDLDTVNVPSVPTAPKKIDTVTGETVQSTLLEEQTDLQKALEKMNEEILQSQLKLEQDMRDVAIDLGRAMVDITKEYAQKRADAERDYANKISDINRNYAEKIASIEAAQWEARQQARVDEEQREREFQNKMQELKEKFLMDLDDALHERNARQILKLIKQYNLDKTQMERQHAIEEQNARETERIQQESFERQKQAAQEARDRELEDAQIDFERKMEELKIQEDREVEAAVLKANRKLQDLERENLDRNTLIAAGLVNDFNLTQSMLGQIDQLFTDHYGYVTGVYQAMMAMLSQPIQLGAVTTSGTTTGTLPPAGGIGGTENPGMGGSNASSDMRSKFGGLSKLPIISRTKMDTNRVFSGMGGSGRSGRDGALTIDLTLSPDLEARVVKNTMDKTADVITKVRRSK